MIDWRLGCQGYGQIVNEDSQKASVGGLKGFSRLNLAGREKKAPVVVTNPYLNTDLPPLILPLVKLESTE